MSSSRQALLFVFWAVCELATAQGPSKNVLDFVSYYTGHWDNKAQVEESGHEHDFIQIWIVPVDVPALRPDIAVNASIYLLYVDFLARLHSEVCHCFLSGRLTYPRPVVVIKEVMNGMLRVLHLGVVSDGQERNTVIMKLYNVSDIAKVNPRKFDVRILHNLTQNDLHGSEDCFGMFNIVEKGFVCGNYPYCSSAVNGKHPRISVSITCNSAAVTFPVAEIEKSPIGPYVYHHTGQRYPLINPPEDYQSPCDQ